MRILLLGPAGTNSHEAAQNLFPKAEIVFQPNFETLFSALESSGDLGLVPVENSLHGSVDEVLDLLIHSTVKTWKTYDVTIRHALGGKNRKAIKRIASHPQALSQCREYLRTQFPLAEQFPVSSTAYAIELALSDPSIGAIALRKTMEARGLPVMEEDIQRKGNTTRFALVSVRDPFPNEKKTQMSIVLHPTEDRSGLLHDLLTPFKIYDVNLTKIESRPTGEKLGDYLFFIDLLGTKDSPRVMKLFEEIEHIARINILGEW